MSHRIASTLRFTAALILGSTAIIAFAEKPSRGDERFQPPRDERQDALAAFRRGDTTTALAHLRLIVDKRPGARDTELQTVENLAAIAYWFSNERQLERAAEVARLAINTAKAASRSSSSEDQAQLWLTVGKLNDLVLGDMNAAEAAFENAVSANPKLQEAKVHSARIKAVKAEAEAKARANGTPARGKN